MSDTIFIAVAWPYANGDLHPGHLAGALLPADIIARYHRLRGRRVLLVSGSDAHGTPITLAADRAGVPPRAIFEQHHHRFLRTLQRLGISFDLFTHTDTANHARVAQTLFHRLHDAGYIVEGTQELFYSPTRSRFLPDRYVEGICPRCGSDGARGDQCDACGALLDSTSLLQPRSALSSEPLELRATRTLLLDLPALAPQLRRFVELRAGGWRPDVAGVARAWLDEGLHARAITRDLSWGVPVPLPGWEDRTLYIWFENIIGYLSAAIEWADRRGTPEAWRDFWYAPGVRSLYFLGKDNIPFHTILWPAELLGAERLDPADGPARFNLPDDVPANQYLTFERAQFSKSRGHGATLDDLLANYAPDAIRYAIAATLPEKRDSDFSPAELIRRNDTELVATWGNLVHRVLTFAWRHFDGQTPHPGVIRAQDRALLAQVAAGFDLVGGHLERVELRAALQAALDLARAVNAYLDSAPWFRVIGTDPGAAATTIHTALSAIAQISTLLAPFLPETAARVRRALGFETPLWGALEITEVSEGQRRYEVLTYSGIAAGVRWAPEPLPAGQPLQELPPLFPRLRDRT